MSCIILRVGLRRSPTCSRLKAGPCPLGLDIGAVVTVREGLRPQRPFAGRRGFNCAWKDTRLEISLAYQWLGDF